VKRLVLLVLILAGIAIAQPFEYDEITANKFFVYDTLPDSACVTQNNLTTAIAAVPTSWDSFRLITGLLMSLTWNVDTLTVAVDTGALHAQGTAWGWGAGGGGGLDTAYRDTIQMARDTANAALAKDSVAKAAYADSVRAAVYADSCRAAAYSDSCRTAVFADSARAVAFADSTRVAAFADSCRVAALVDSARIAAYADSCRAAAYADSCRKAGTAVLSDTAIKIRGNKVDTSTVCTGNAATAGNAALLQGRDSTDYDAAKTAVLADTAVKVRGQGTAGGVAVLPAVLDSLDYMLGNGTVGKRGGAFWETDCHVNTAAAFAPWLIAAIGTGTIAAATGTVNHPGVVQLLASTTAGSGYQVRLHTAELVLAGGEQTDLVARFDTMTSSVSYFGWHDASSATRPVDGVYFDITGTTVRGFTSNNSTRDSTASTYTGTKLLSYRFNVNVATTTKAYFSLYDSVNTRVFYDSLATNIPSTAGREVGHGLIATHTPANEAYPIVDMDYMNAEIRRALVGRRTR
jgi:hypothetical protein